MEIKDELKKTLTELECGEMTSLEARKLILNLFGVSNSFCKHDKCTTNSTCGDFCYKHCNCNKGKND